ncbi:probable inactive leucine-rich repeat receptor-like protein kinase At3g03770 isoform X2 [Carica papaya]|uniref:probable inactive leucine-rich repeat receptor-like protein kinase At3g03770 isoform X2 n=1 Tax=Carica papaya TaxID=3649 RepID=UPI000B8CA228|nr:probable inactive leucine-rich repeat receptor-like protein kinase At3g03770 isoform X2 [Carica papaya]
MKALHSTMEKLSSSSSYHLLLLMLFLAVHPSTQLQPSQYQVLLQIQQLFNFPSNLSNTTDFCSMEPTPSLILSCYEDYITQLHITGNNGDSEVSKMLLPESFSTDSFFSLLASLSTLKVLSLPSLGFRGPLPASLANLSSLEILNVSSNYFNGPIPHQLSNLKNLQTLILDHNEFTGQVPDWLSSLPSLAVLSLKNNLLAGSLPNSMTKLENLRVLDVSNNGLTGEVPDLHNLTNLQVLDLYDNGFGPHFPILHNKLVTLSIRNNSFGFGIPSELGSYYQLKKLDISLNGFVGPFLPSLFSLPSLTHLDISGNKLTGMLFENMSCNSQLSFINLSSNLLTGELPSCLKSTDSLGKMDVVYGKNCLWNEEQEQNPPSFCHKEALAVEILPHDRKRTGKPVLASSMLGGTIGVIAVVCLIFLAVKKRGKQFWRNCSHVKGGVKVTSTRLILEKVSAINTAKLLTDARCISQTMKLGASLPAYRTFALEELKEATKNFDASSLLRKGANHESYRGKLSDGSLVVIRKLKMIKKRNPYMYTSHIEKISKLRYNHLVSSLGHCFECLPDDSGVSNIYLIFEFVPNGTLRDWTSGGGFQGPKFSWKQRIAAAIEVAKGVQFLHTGLLPGVFSNNMKITDVLLDQNLHVKISSYNLPLFAGNGEMAVAAPKTSLRERFTVGKDDDDDKKDVFDIGVILLEIIVGRPIMSQNEVVVMKDLVGMSADATARRSIIDPAMVKECSDESLKVVMEICIGCVNGKAGDRPSVEDIVWNLQFAAQVEDSWRGDHHNNIQHSPVSCFSSQEV